MGKRRHVIQRHCFGGAATGVATGAIAGAATGTVVGPVGTVIGAAVGAIVGGLAGKGVAEVIDPTSEEVYWRESFKGRPYANGASVGSGSERAAGRSERIRYRSG